MRTTLKHDNRMLLSRPDSIQPPCHPATAPSKTDTKEALSKYRLKLT